MFFALLFSGLALASQTEVGNGKNFGLGFQLGAPTTFTGKLWFNDASGGSFHVGTWFGSYFEGRVQYEQRFVQFGDWNFADLGMYWAAGISTHYWIWAGNEFQIGVCGGVGAEMRFKEVPAAVFLETEVGVNILGFEYYPVTFTSGAGGRWYF